MSLPFLGWYNADPDLSSSDKLEEAIERFVEKFGEEPSHALVSEKDAPSLHERGGWAVQIRGLGYIQPNTFYVGDNPGV
jgi:hypothetical protein